MSCFTRLESRVGRDEQVVSSRRAVTVVSSRRAVTAVSSHRAVTATERFDARATMALHGVTRRYVTLRDRSWRSDGRPSCRSRNATLHGVTRRTLALRRTPAVSTNVYLRPKEIMLSSIASRVVPARRHVAGRRSCRSHAVGRSRAPTPRHTPSHPVTPRHTSSHPVTPRHTPSHPVTPHRTPSHPVTPRYTPFHPVYSPSHHPTRLQCPRRSRVPTPSVG